MCGRLGKFGVGREESEENCRNRIERKLKKTFLDCLQRRRKQLDEYNSVVKFEFMGRIWAGSFQVV